MKKISGLVLILIFVTFFSCKEEKSFSYSADDLKMADVLVDIFTVDAAIIDLSGFKKDSLKAEYFKQIYQIHQIDSSWLVTQKTRLDADPIRMDSVYTKAVKQAKSMIGARRKL